MSSNYLEENLYFRSFKGSKFEDEMKMKMRRDIQLATIG